MRKRRLAGFPIDLHELCPGGQFFWRVLLELDISTDNSLKKMDLDEFRTLFESSGVDIWTVIDMAITVASLDYCKEFKVRRDDIVARLYATTSRCYNCDTDSARLSAPEIKPKHESRIMEESREREGRDAGETQNSPRKLGDLDGSQGNLVVMKIKELLDSDQPQETLIELLQRLLSMHISVETLKETEIGRQVLELRKHSSNEIRKLVKRVLGKWRDLVDEWCISSGGVAAAATIGSDCNGDKMNVETDSKGKRVKQTFESCDNSTRASDQASHEYAQLNGVDIEIREGQAKQKPPVLKSGLTQLASVKEQLEEKHQEVQNGKRQRTTQVMELRNHPKELLTCWNIVFDSLLKPKGNELFK